MTVPHYECSYIPDVWRDFVAVDENGRRFELFAVDSICRAREYAISAGFPVEKIERIDGAMVFSWYKPEGGAA